MRPTTEAIASGVPEEQRDRLRTVVDTVFDTTAAPEQQQANGIAMYELMTHLVELKRAAPADDLTSALIAHPGQLALVRAGERGWPDVVGEALRWQAPVAYLPLRYAVEDIDVAGVTIHQGDAILAAYAAAGQDPAHYGARAAEFDITRDNKQHLAFGHGVHHCLGAPLARLEARIALRAVRALPGCLARGAGCGVGADAFVPVQRASRLARVVALRRVDVVETSLKDQSVLVIGRPSGIAGAIARAARADGAQVVVAGRDAAKIRDAYADDDGVHAETVDVTDDATIAALADRLAQRFGGVDHVISTASARARGLLPDLDRAALLRSFDTKVIGPVMLAKHFAPIIRGSFTLFSGVAAFKPAVGYLGVAITNGAADFLTRSLALELAPIRVNAISPGVIDTGIWDALGEEGKREYFEHFRTHNPARRIGTAEDIAAAAIFAMTNPFLTGVTLRVDGGEPLT